MISRTQRALLEYGAFGPSLSGKSGPSQPVGIDRNSSFPFAVDVDRERDRTVAMHRRRARLQELSSEWALRPRKETAPAIRRNGSLNNRGQAT